MIRLSRESENLRQQSWISFSNEWCISLLELDVGAE